MRVTRRIGLLAAATGLLVTASSVGATVPAGAVEPAGATTVQVEGTLLMAQPDGPGARPSYAVALADGDLVPVRGSLSDARPMSHVSARLALPASVLAGLAARGTSLHAGATLDGSSTTGRAALRLVDRRSLTLRLTGAPVLTDPEPTVTPTAHQQFVAALDNKGALGQDDTALLGHVSAVGSYWEGESNGAISSIGVPATVTHYDTAVTTTDCGLGNDFWSVVQEAEGKFPTLNLGAGDQVVLFVPGACASGSIVGEGTVGSSFASGGALIVKAGTSIEGTYAHETGHNYGFNHANARSSGTSMEYYGIYDVMGFALPPPYNQLTALSTPYRVFQGVTDAGEIQDVDLGTKTVAVHATATIKPRSDGSGVRSVRVVDPDTGEKLYLDYRSGTGEDAGSAYLAQVSTGGLHYAPGVTLNAARTVNGTPSGVDTLVVDDAGDTSLGAGATWTNASGSLSVHVSSLSAAGADVSVDFAPPVIAPAPTPSVSGTPRVGATLHATTGTWMSGVTLTYRWFVDDVAVAGATGRSYDVRAVDLGKTIHVAVTGHRAGFPAVTRTSDETPVIGIGVLTTSKPTIVGLTKVGKKLTAVAGVWTRGTRLSYAWYANGKAIKHATAKRLTLTKAQKGKRITVKVTGKQTGYRTVSRTSAKTAKVT